MVNVLQDKEKIMGKAVYIILIFLLMQFISCTTLTSLDPLPGKIACTKFLERDWLVFMNSETPSFSFSEKKGDVEHRLYSWMNTRDEFFGTEIFKDGAPFTRSNIVTFDLSGNLKERIYLAETGEIASAKYPSRDDKYLLFTSYRLADPEVNPFENLAPLLTLGVMDLQQNKVIFRIDNIGRPQNFEMLESPWIASDYRFVYSLRRGAKLMKDGNLVNPFNEDTAGVYLFNLKSGDHKLLVPDAQSAIGSPVSNQIAYEKNNLIKVLNIENNEEKVICRLGANAKIDKIHFSPDGRYLYLLFTYTTRIGNFKRSAEKMIDIGTGKEKRFKHIKNGFYIRTWK